MKLTWYLNGYTSVRTYETDASGAPIQTDLPYSLLVAHPSYDMWSLGVTPYQVLQLRHHIAIIDFTCLMHFSTFFD